MEKELIRFFNVVLEKTNLQMDEFGLIVAVVFPVLTGNHDTLLSKKGRYYELYITQYAGMNI